MQEDIATGDNLPGRVEAPGRQPSFFRAAIRVWGLVAACAVLCCIATLLGFLGRFWWVFDLFSHFRLQLFFGLAVLTLAFLFRRAYRISLCLGACAILNFGTIAPFYVGRSPAPPEGAATNRVLLINVNTEAGNPAKVAQAVQRFAPDILVLEEVDERWLSSLAKVLVDYPFSTAMPREDNFGIALFSRHPPVASEIRHIGEAGLPSIVAQLELGKAKITVIATHPLPPGGAENSRLRNDQLRQLAAVTQEVGSPVLMVGDLNTTPWSYHFKRLLRDSGLEDSSKGRGVLPTWPTFFPLLLIPIDHVLHSKSIRIVKKSAGPDVGSDHYPLLVDFVADQ